MLTPTTLKAGDKITYRSLEASLMFSQHELMANRWIHTFGPVLEVADVLDNGTVELVIPEERRLAAAEGRFGGFMRMFKAQLCPSELAMYFVKQGGSSSSANTVHAEDSRQQLSALQRPIAKTYRMSDTHDQYNRSIGLNARGNSVTMVFRVTKRRDNAHHLQRMSFTPEQARDMAVQLQHIADNLE